MADILATAKHTALFSVVLLFLLFRSGDFDPANVPDWRQIVQQRTLAQADPQMPEETAPAPQVPAPVVDLAPPPAEPGSRAAAAIAPTGQEATTTATNQPQTPEARYYHDVGPGESIGTIAARLQMTPADLLAANPTVGPEGIIVEGQRLNVPGEKIGTLATTPPSAPAAVPQPPANSNVVQRGDTFYAIARRLNVPFAALWYANPHITNPARIVAGQRLNVPTQADIAASANPRPIQPAAAVASGMWAPTRQPAPPQPEYFYPQPAAPVVAPPPGTGRPVPAPQAVFDGQQEVMGVLASGATREIEASLDPQAAVMDIVKQTAPLPVPTMTVQENARSAIDYINSVTPGGWEDPSK